MLTEKDYGKIVPFIWKIKKGEWIFPGDIISQFKISQDDACILLATLSETGAIATYYAPLCVECGYPIGMPVEKLEDLSGDEFCEKCDCEIDLENIVVVFKKMMDTITKDEYDAQRRIANRKNRKKNQKYTTIH